MITFLTATAAAVSAVMGGMLLRPKKDAVPLQVPYAALAVAGMAVGLTALGFWMLD